MRTGKVLHLRLVAAQPSGRAAQTKFGLLLVSETTTVGHVHVTTAATVNVTPAKFAGVAQITVFGVVWSLRGSLPWWMADVAWVSVV